MSENKYKRALQEVKEVLENCVDPETPVCQQLVDRINEVLNG